MNRSAKDHAKFKVSQSRGLAQVRAIGQVETLPG
jgi:hypothetical protein